MSFRLYNPEIFQGNLKLKKYFEGWYYKHVSQDLNEVYSFIPGISLSEKDSHSFIQVINGIVGKSAYIKYPLEKFTWDKNQLYLRIGESVFTDSYIDLNINNKDIEAEGHLDYIDMVKYPIKLLSPGIMGWYSFIPSMECKHGIVSVNHSIKGSIKVNGHFVDLNGGKGYIEKDWGTSFPESWLWIQANNFNDQDTSFSFSVAKIPWRGKFFIGFIAFLYFNRKFYMFTTYNKSVIRELNHSGNSINMTLKNHNSILKVSTEKNTFGELRAPVSGNMTRRIKESIDSVVDIKLFNKNNDLIYHDSSNRAGLEVIDKIFDYINVKSTEEFK